MSFLLFSRATLSIRCNFICVLPVCRKFTSQIIEKLSLTTLKRTNCCRTVFRPKNAGISAVKYVTNKATKLPFENVGIGKAARQDVTVYSYRNDRFFKMLTVFGGIQLIFWANLGLFFFTVPMAQLNRQGNASGNEKSTNGWSGIFYTWLSEYQKRVGGACIALGSLAVLFALFYPLRSVSRLTLLKGGEKVNITTYSHFGQMRQFTVPVNDISCTRSRSAAAGSPISMKIRGKWMYFTLDTRDGQFTEPELFDHVVGLNRSIK